jgi:hypothetical protein
VAKLPKVKQAVDEIVNDDFCRVNKTQWELKSNIDPATIYVVDVILPAAVAAQRGI